MLLRTWKALRQKGVMGINERNADYVLRHNRRSLYPMVDDKLTTKERGREEGIRVPELYAMVESERGIPEALKVLASGQNCVIKPARGAGGDGILVITDRFEGFYRSATGRLLDEEDLWFHFSGILSGMYSLGGQRDRAIVEYQVQPDEVFGAISFGGVPDIRVIVLHGYPVMAMLRLPTRESGGKANLHQGALGVGVDLASGVTLGGTWHNRTIGRHPDTMNPVDGVTLPQWNEFLRLSARCYELTGLGYLGVDLVLDRTHGPMMLELNARPGLNIQIANDAGLSHRCAVVEARLGDLEDGESPEERVAFCQRAFASA